MWLQARLPGRLLPACTVTITRIPTCRNTALQFSFLFHLCFDTSTLRPCPMHVPMLINAIPLTMRLLDICFCLLTPSFFLFTSYCNTNALCFCFHIPCMLEVIRLSHNYCIFEAMCFSSPPPLSLLLLVLVFLSCVYIMFNSRYLYLRL